MEVLTGETINMWTPNTTGHLSIVQGNELTVGKRYNKRNGNLRNTWMIKLSPRFKIYHNISEDYYFIKERFCFFWYRTMRTLSGYEYYTVDRFGSLADAEKYIEDNLEYEEQSKIPDEIKLVKEL
jgi:hypothetical protein